MGLAAFLTLTATIGAPATMMKEGTSLTPYFDKIGKKVTWCTGETEVGYQEHFTFEECGALFKMRYGVYSYAVANMYNDVARETVTPEIHAALTDTAYNVGIGSVKRSTMIYEINQGHAKKACDAILLYNAAPAPLGSPADLSDGRANAKADCSKAGKWCRGLWTRRLEMNKMCLSGVQ